MIKLGTRRNAKLIERKVKAGTLKKIYRGIYLEPRDKAVTYSEIILQTLGIQGIISYASALEYPKHIHNNTLYVVGNVNKKIHFKDDDLVIHVLKKGDTFTYWQEMLVPTDTSGLFVLEFDVACLVQFFPSSLFEKRSNKDLACAQIIQAILCQHGDIAKADIYFRALQHKAKHYNLEKAFTALVAYFKTYYKTRHLSFDEKRLGMFEKVREYLLSTPPLIFPAKKQNTLFFFEAYFTNYIEGTEFEIEEAEKIVFDPRHRYERHKDGNDIVATYGVIQNIVSSPMSYDTYEDFERCLKQTHHTMMAHRKDEICVGEFKKKINRSGALRFVLPEQVVPTLKKGFALFMTLDEPFHRALFMMVMLSEIHPFEDGNGRIARLFMNNEFSRGGRLHLLIPTVFRDEYITALKGFSHQENVSAIVRALAKAYKITQQIDWDLSREAVREYIKINSGFEKDTHSMWGIHPLKSDASPQEDAGKLPFDLPF